MSSLQHFSVPAYRRLVIFAGLACLWAATSCLAGSVTLTTLVTFNGSNGAHPVGLLQGNDGNFYGTTWGDTNANLGTAFRLAPGGAFTNLLVLTSSTGEHPNAGLFQGADGNFYGTTETGGQLTDGGLNGTIFQLKPDGTFTLLFSFGGTNGAVPLASLVQDANGNFFGTTVEGPFSFPNSGNGTIFELTADGEFRSLVSFDGTNGANPYDTLALGNDGNLYGTTFSGGTNNLGTVFQVTPNGTLTTLASFAGTNGAKPNAGLVLGSDGNFYGTTSRGGASNAGTVFRMSPDGILATLASFNNANGNGPFASLLPATGGSFYGTTSAGSGVNRWGSVFRVTTNGVLTTVYAFHGSADGGHPFSGVIRGSDGNLYGAAFYGGVKNNGTIYRLALSRPVLAIMGPRQNARVTNAIVAVSGKSMGADPVAGVYCQGNGGGWSLASTTNGWTNWTCSLTLSPGANLVQTYSVGGLGKTSLTNKLKLTYVVYAPLTVETNGNGSVVPNYDGRWLEVGKSYTMTARPAIGFAFQNWSGGLTTNAARISFLMDSNLTFKASFVDVMRPVCTITYPAPNQLLTNNAITVLGKVKDNAGVTTVLYQLNGGGWNAATTSNYWTNWMASNLGLSAGTNIIQAYAVDRAGNSSFTNTLKFFH